MHEELQKGVQSFLASLETFDHWNRTQNWGVHGAPLSPTATLECSQILQSAEAALEHALHAVRSSINALSPVNRLPTDVLKSIFDWVSPPIISGFLPVLNGDERLPHIHFHGDAQFIIPPAPSPQLSLFHWLQIAAVCRHWRDVAFNSSASWSTIAIGPASTPSSIVDMQIRRSGNRPIDLHACTEIREPEMTQVRRFDWSTLDLPSLIPRLRSLHLHSAVPAHDAHKILQKLNRPAHLLEHLTVSPSSEMSPRVTLQGLAVFFGHALLDNPSRVMPRLFQNELPRLKSLTVGFFTTWPGNKFHSLTRLCLQHQRSSFQPPGQPPQTYPRADFFGFLNASPNLEELVLADVLELLDDGGAAVLNLQHLKTLVVTGWSAASSALFFSSLLLPNSCALYLKPSGSDTDALHKLWERSALEKMHTFLRDITRLYLRYPTFSAPTNLHVIACGRGGGFYFESLERNFIQVHQHINVPPPAPRPLPISPEYATLYSAMSLDELWVDVVRFSEQATLTQWYDLFHSMPGVTKIVILVRHWRGGEPTLTCIDALGDRDGDLCLPNLSELHLIQCRNVTGGPVSALQRIQAQRAARGVPIRKLVVGAEPPLVLYEENVKEVQEKLGTDVVCGMQEVSFNWSPFKERQPYERHWPVELCGRLPELWSAGS